MAAKIFISYRREDCRDQAGRIYDRLSTAFGRSDIFMDIDNLRPGERFDRKLEEALQQCDIFLAMIGRDWTGHFAKRQEMGERDYVREEIATALLRGMPVIPVLIDRTPMPRADQIPENISDLVVHQKIEVEFERFDRDVAALIEDIKAMRPSPTGIASGSVAPTLKARRLADPRATNFGVAAWKNPL